MGMNPGWASNVAVLVIDEASCMSTLSIEEEARLTSVGCCERRPGDIVSLLGILAWVSDTDLSSTAEVLELELAAGVSNLRYCANTLLHVLHIYSPFSIKVTPSPSCSFGFS